MLLFTDRGTKGLFAERINAGRFSPFLLTFEKVQDQLQSLAPLHIDHPLVILGVSPSGDPEVIEEIETSAEKHQKHIAIDRFIEFPPEYQQAGIGILNYFGKVLQEKYPDEKVSIKISQTDSAVRMLVETVNGSREVIEKAFKEYGMVVRGEMSVEQFASSDRMIVELKTELRIANLRLETQRDLLTIKDAQIGRLLSIMEKSIVDRGGSQPIEITVSPTINVSQNAEQHIEMHISELESALEDFAATTSNVPELAVYSEGLVSAIQEEKSEINASNAKASPVLQKIRALLEGVGKAGSSFQKALECANGGIKAAQKLARTYNALASWVGLPSVPDLLVK